jgi:O-antigen ligase
VVNPVAGTYTTRTVSDTDLAAIADAQDPSTAIHWMAFVAGVVLLLLKAANVPELVYTITGANLKILYFVVPFAYIGILFSQGLDAALRNKSVIFFLLFYLWMALATPSSSWVGGSVGRVKDFGIHMVPLLLVGSAMIMSWKQVRITFGIMALAAVIVLVSTRYFGEMNVGRISLSSSGTIGNSNDLAAHLLLMLSFLLYVLLDTQRNLLFRGIAIVSIAYGLYVILGTGSRGALVALGAGGLFFLVKAQMKVRIGFVVSALLMLTILPAVLPEATKARLGSLFGEQHEEAEESEASRSYLFWKSVEYSFAHPVFGVGPDQFSNFEGTQSRAAGRRGNWHATHCSWTQVSSECGIPALIFLTLALGTALLPLYRCYCRARELGVADVARASFCLLIGSITLLVAVTFLAQAYNFYFALVIGLAIATARAGQRQLRLVPTLEMRSPTTTFRF